MAPQTSPYILMKLSLHLAATMRPRMPKKRERGFVLPIAILIVVVLLLITSLLLSRSFNRNVETTVTRSGQIANRRLATAFDRARAKIDYLLDPKLSNADKYVGAGEPSDDELRGLLLNQPVYTLADENRLTITSTQNPNIQAPAWWFPIDDDQDGTPDSINAYMIVHNTRRTRLPTPTTDCNNNDSSLGDPSTCADTVKAALLQVRNGPLEAAAVSPGCEAQASRVNVGDWFTSRSTSAELLKPFQVFAVNIPLSGGSALSSAVAAGQIQHDRVRQSLARWAAWFRYDLEVYQTRDFQWNGATHTEGSYILGAANLDPTDALGGNGFRHYLISAPASCFYLPKDNSEISIRGELISAELGNNRFVRAAANLVPFRIDLHPNTRIAPVSDPNPALNQVWTLTDDNPIVGAARDSVIPRTRENENTPVPPDSMALDPLAMIAFDQYYPRDPQVRDLTQNTPWNAVRDRRATGWDNSPLTQGEPPEYADDGRVKVNDQGRCAPYVDDTYRADNRFGPKISYQPETTSETQPTCSAAPFTALYKRGTAPVVPGERIDSGVTSDPNAPTVDELIRINPPAGAGPESVGLDGYWERRARLQGLRVIVGQRLELDKRTVPYPLSLVPNPTASLDPTAPDTLNWRAALMSNQARQRQTFQDHLAAVQATAVYHYSQNDGLFPVACLATTVHPGTPATLRQSATFGGNPIPAITGATVLPDFFFGGMPVDLNGDGVSGGPQDLDWDGTNGWEFEPPATNATNFATSLGPNEVLGKALRNLANFAGDPDGAYPPLQEPGRIHPDPLLTAFGNFSELRAVLARLDAGVAYGDLSLAEQTTLQTAACTVRMLAYNLSQIEKLPDDAGSLPVHPLEQDIRDILADGSLNNTIEGSKTITPTNRPRHTYLPLYYLFPAADHAEQRTGIPAITAANTGVEYKQITLAELSTLALSPRTVANWVLPNSTISAASAGCGTACPESNRYNLIQNGNQLRRIAFKDRAFFDGRELETVRTLDIDIDLLRRTAVGTSTDRWLPREGGVVYAFREDAVREDAIARQPLPQTGGGGLTWANFLTAWQNAKANPHGATGDPFVMNAGQVDNSDPEFALEPRDPSMDRGFDRTLNPTEAKRAVGVGDPPLVDGRTRGISPKVVDYYPDPDRRPYGFRLRNARRLDRPADANGIRHGMSFITDNPVYVQGDFNLHQSNSGMGAVSGDGSPTFQDEFTNPGGGGFYDRTGINPNYATGSDTWRPTDILADSITILSENFCDGSLNDGFLQDGSLTNSLLGPQDSFKLDRSALRIRRSAYGCGDTPQNNVTSYLGQPLLYAPTTWPY